MRLLSVVAMMCGLASMAHAQWSLQDSHTTDDLRGIDYVGNGVAWASGTSGTVLRTVDDGKIWTTCAVPPDAEHLDFRGVQAFDANTAIVMSSGKGDLSRLYKTMDGCKSWKLVFTNPYLPDGFFDALIFIDPEHGILFGDPTHGMMAVECKDCFRIRVTANGGNTWGPVSAPDEPGSPGNGLHSLTSEASFAASNSSIALRDGWFWFATSAGRVASRQLYETATTPELFFHSAYCAGQVDALSGECGQPWTDFTNSFVPIVHSSPSAGIFSLYFRTRIVGLAVGGNYQKPDDGRLTAAFSINGGKVWHDAHTMPHGYRSAVAYDANLKTWITVGPNGTDISTDDGRNWRAVHPVAALNESPDADRNWNALSLPFVVGPHGRIGKLDADALRQSR
jgi:photosystem II stability/assembly factor-like uncharacterized protein